MALQSPVSAFLYARDVLKGRWLEAEKAIAKSHKRDDYLKLFPEAKDEWLINGWLDWLDA